VYLLCISCRIYIDTHAWMSARALTPALAHRGRGGEKGNTKKFFNIVIQTSHNITLFIASTLLKDSDGVKVIFEYFSLDKNSR